MRQPNNQHQNPNAFQACKRSLAVSVDFAASANLLQTLEGKVRYEAGDALLTGIEGEQWPVQRKKFDATYKAKPPTVHGQKGIYTKIPKTVWAWCATEEVEVPLSAGRGSLKAKPGDFVVQYGGGDIGVVGADIFEKTYIRLGGNNNA